MEKLVGSVVWFFKIFKKTYKLMKNLRNRNVLRGLMFLIISMSGAIATGIAYLEDYCAPIIGRTLSVCVSILLIVLSIVLMAKIVRKIIKYFSKPGEVVVDLTTASQLRQSL